MGVRNRSTLSINFTWSGWDRIVVLLVKLLLLFFLLIWTSRTEKPSHGVFSPSLSLSYLTEYHRSPQERRLNFTNTHTLPSQYISFLTRLFFAETSFNFTKLPKPPGFLFFFPSSAQKCSLGSWLFLEFSESGCYLCPQ